MNKSIRIMHLITTLDVGGAENMLLKIINNSHADFQHKVIYLKGRGNLIPLLRNQKDLPFCLNLENGISAIRAMRFLFQSVKRYQPDIIQTWLYHADLLGLVVGKMARAGIILWNVRCSYIDFSEYALSSRIVFKLLKYMSSAPTGIIYNSESGRTMHQQAGYSAKLCHVIPNGFDLDQFRPNLQARGNLRCKLGIPEKAPVIGMVARYDPIKRHRCFIDAARILVNYIPDVRFILVGEGVDRRNNLLLQQIKRYDLANRFFLLGSQQSMQEIYPAFDIHTLTSYSEGFPNVIGEAMACGIPCVATDAGDTASIIGDAGVLVPVGEPQCLADAWTRILRRSSEEKLILSIAARKRIADRFDIQSIVTKYESFYQGLYENASKPKDKG